MTEPTPEYALSRIAKLLVRSGDPGALWWLEVLTWDTALTGKVLQKWVAQGKPLDPVGPVG